MFKNGEGYPDPTFGGAYAKIRHEEKVKAREEIAKNAEKKRQKHIKKSGGVKS